MKNTEAKRSGRCFSAGVFLAFVLVALLWSKVMLVRAKRRFAVGDAPSPHLPWAVPPPAGFRCAKPPPPSCCGASALCATHRSPVSERRSLARCSNPIYARYDMRVSVLPVCFTGASLATLGA